MDFYFPSTGLQDLSEVLCSTDRILLGVEPPNSTDGISTGVVKTLPKPGKGACM